MARLPRFVLPGFPQHVIQRGNNRQRILFEEDDYWFIWEKLKVAAERFQCSIHAYTLMPNHFHLLLTPHQDNGIGKLMQYVGRYYVQYFNKRYERNGTLWEGRYRATLVDPENYLLPVSRYIESNPVRAGLVDAPDSYEWSSHAANALGDDDPLVIAHPEYERLANSPKGRRQRYAEIAQRVIEDPLLSRIRDTTNKAWVLGDKTFCEHIDRQLNRRALPRPRGGDRRSAAYRLRSTRTMTNPA